MPKPGQHALPAPPSPEGDKPPDNIVEHLQAVGRAASAVGDLLKEPDKVTLGDLRTRVGALLRLVGLSR